MSFEEFYYQDKTINEEQFFNEILEPLEKEAPEPDAEELEKEMSDVNPFDIAYKTSEHKKRTVLNIKAIGATTIVRNGDILLGNLAARIAGEPENVVEYRAPEDMLQELEKAVEEALPDSIKWLEKQPVFVQILVLFLIIYVPIFIQAFIKRMQNNALAETTEQNPKQKFNIIKNQENETE